MLRMGPSARASHCVTRAGQNMAVVDCNE
jgi:hypothetical protein